VTTDATITVEYEPGFHIICCDVTAINEPDANDQHLWAYRYIWVVDDTYRDFSDQYAVEIINDSTTENEGREMQFRIDADAASLLYVGAPALFTFSMRHGEDYDIEGTANEADWHSQQFSGYITEFTAVEDDGDVAFVEITVSSPLRLMQKEGIAPQMVVVDDGSANDWTKTIAAHMNLKWFIHWLIAHHMSAILILHDYDPTDMDDWEDVAFKTDRGSVWDAIQAAAAYCKGGRVACTWDGTIVARRDLRYEITTVNDTYLDALDSYTLTGDDIADKINYAFSPLRTTYETRGEYFIAATTAPLTARLTHSSPYAPGRGVRSAKTAAYLALSNLDGRARTGQADMIENLPVKEQGFKLASYFGAEFYDPAYRQYYVTDLTAYDPMGRDLHNNGQWVLKETSLAWGINDETQEWKFEAVIKLMPIPRGIRAKREFLPPILQMGQSALVPTTTLTLSTFTALRTGSGTFGSGVWSHGDYEIDMEDGETVYVRGIEIYKAINKYVNLIEFDYELTGPLDNDEFPLNIRVMSYDPNDDISVLFPSHKPLDAAASTLTGNTRTFKMFYTSVYIENLVIAVFSSSVLSGVGTYSGAAEISGVRYREIPTA
jgi:hypothetical protein